MTNISWPARQEANRRGVAAAARLHTELGLDETKQIDIFKVIEGFYIWLMFQPLKNLYGVYRKEIWEGEVLHGILLNSNYPLSVQRFTAAHELGHYYMKHETSVDDGDDILPRQKQSNSISEIEAQAFAAYFLMPPRLVYSTLRQQGLPRLNAQPSAEDVYQMSLKMGSSYTATLTHMRSLDIIDSSTYQGLINVYPRKLKQNLLGGQDIASSRNDVWPLHLKDEGVILTPRINDEVVLSLPESPSTGYTWTADSVQEKTPQEILEIVSDQYSETLDDRLGKTGIRRVILRINGTGDFNVLLHKRRPWQPLEQAVERFEFSIHVEQPPTGDVAQGVVTEQRPWLAA